MLHVQLYINIIIFIQHAFNEAMYLVEQADDDKDGMVTSYNVFGCLFNCLYISVVTGGDLKS